LGKPIPSAQASGKKEVWGKGFLKTSSKFPNVVFMKNRRKGLGRKGQNQKGSNVREKGGSPEKGQTPSTYLNSNSPKKEQRCTPEKQNLDEKGSSLKKTRIRLRVKKHVQGG